MSQQQSARPPAYSSPPSHSHLYQTSLYPVDFPIPLFTRPHSHRPPYLAATFIQEPPSSRK